MPQLDQLTAQLDRLSAFDAGPFPVVSLYLNLRPDGRGRDRFAPFLRKELSDRLRTYPANTPERESLQQDAAKIKEYVDNIDASANSLALFACSAAGLFEANQLAASLGDHRLYISDQPHLYPLARLLDEYSPFIALVADTQSARIFVFAATGVEHTDRIDGTKTKRHKVGGMSQARYQRHTENYHLHHAKEIVDVLVRTARDEGIERIVVAGDEVIVPLLREQIPKDIAERIVDVVHLDINAPQRDIFDTTIPAILEQDAASDRERVEALIGAYRASGLACAGIEQTRRALEMGQVDELVITAAPETITGVKKAAATAQAGESVQDRAANELVALARNTGASIRFIEDASILQPIGGVGAFLRFKI